jgi:hypothetical protein
MTKTKKGEKGRKAQESGCDRNKEQDKQLSRKQAYLSRHFGFFLGLSWLLSCIFGGLSGFAAPFIIIKFASPKKGNRHRNKILFFP